MSPDNKSLFLMIDMQDKLLKVVSKKDIAGQALVFLKACSLLGIPVVVTEQYPAGLGSTTSILTDSFPTGTSVFEKTDFSALRSSEIASCLSRSGCRRIVVCGVETHICVFQTVLDLLANGYEVCLLREASSSRFDSDEQAAVDALMARGVSVWSLEMILFDLLKSARHPNFKAVQALIKER